MSQPVNLLNEKALNQFLADQVYHGQEMEVFTKGEFQSTVFVKDHKDEIVRSIVLQWFKHRMRTHLSTLSESSRDYLIPVRAEEENLPDWARRNLAEGKDVYRFDGAKMPEQLKNKITEVRDFLYAMAENYVNKTLIKAEETDKSPRLRLDYLKTTNDYEDFDKVHNMAQKWHKLLLEKSEKQQRNEEMYKKSLQGTKPVMQLADGMEIVQLTTPEALDYESTYMGHCVGKGGYDSGVSDGSIKIYSLRDKDGEPHATFEVRGNQVHQCKGKGNKRPTQRYIPFVQEFIEKSGFEIVGDSKNIGLLKQDGKYYNIFDLPKGFVIKEDLDLSEMDLEELPDLSTVTVLGSFYCYHNQLTSLKGAPQEVGGNFKCSDNQLTSLEHAPQKVGGGFFCTNNQLTSLKGAPQEVRGSFNCSDNQLTSLEHAPQKVGGVFWCPNNQLTSLKGAPQEVGDFVCTGNQLTSLEGAPQEVRGSFNCHDNQLTNLEGAPQKVGGGFFCTFNQLTSLKGAPQEVGGGFDCSHNQLTSLEGAPQIMRGDFRYFHNHLTSTEGAPKEVKGSFDCSHNHLTSLEHAPQEVGGDFDCSDNQLTSLEHAPKKVWIRSEVNPIEPKETKTKVKINNKVIKMFRQFLGR